MDDIAVSFLEKIFIPSQFLAVYAGKFGFKHRYNKIFDSLNQVCSQLKKLSDNWESHVNLNNRVTCKNTLIPNISNKIWYRILVSVKNLTVCVHPHIFIFAIQVKINA